MAEAFGLQDAPTLITKTLKRSTLSVTELKCGRMNFGKTAPIPREDAYLIGLQFLPCLDHDLYFDGRKVKPTNWFPGVTTIYDLRRDPVADLRDPFHSLMFYLPRKALDTLAYESGVPRIGDLKHEPGVGIEDPVVRHLLSSLLPSISSPGEAQSLFLDHVALALIVHVAHVYGGMRRDIYRGGLAPRQLRRIEELIAANPFGQVELSVLAGECGLSVRHFSRAFARSTGSTPHKWMLTHKVNRAKDMLLNRKPTLAEIALACGFADQSHFTHAFTKLVGCTPGQWRRQNASFTLEKDSQP